MSRTKPPAGATAPKCPLCGDTMDTSWGRAPVCLRFDCWAALRRIAHPNDIDIPVEEIERLFTEAKRDARRRLTLSREDTLRQPGG